MTTEPRPQFTRHQIVRSGYVRDTAPHDRIICHDCGNHADVPRGQTIPLTAPNLHHTCGEDWTPPDYTPHPAASRRARTAPTLTAADRLAFEQAARKQDVNA